MNWKSYIIGCAICIYVFGCNEEEEGFDYSLCTIEWPADTYDYPVKPGTEEWGLLSSSREMDSVLQLPDGVIHNISTEGLLQTCMNYPRMADIYFNEYLNFQHSFEIITDHFNGLQELFDRSHAGIISYEYYRQLYPECDKNNWSERPLGPAFIYAWTEIIIAQYVILGQFDTEMIRLLCSDALNVYQKKRSLDYSLFSLKASLWISGRIMLVNEYGPLVQAYNTNNSVKWFIDFSVLDEHYINTLDEIEKHTENYLSE